MGGKKTKMMREERKQLEKGYNAWMSVEAVHRAKMTECAPKFDQHKASLCHLNLAHEFAHAGCADLQQKKQISHELQHDRQ